MKIKQIQQKLVPCTLFFIDSTLIIFPEICVRFIIYIDYFVHNSMLRIFENLIQKKNKSVTYSESKDSLKSVANSALVHRPMVHSIRKSVTLIEVSAFFSTKSGCSD